MAITKLSTSGILDFAKYRSMLAGNSPYIPFISDYDLLETEILASDTASVTFSSLNTTYGSTYQHLQLRIAARSTRAFTGDYVALQFNSDTSSNYSSHYLVGDGSSVTSAADATLSFAQIGRVSAATAGSNVFGAVVCDILDPFSSSKYTTTRGFSGFANSGYNRVELVSSHWRNTNALTSITVTANNGSLAQYSRFSIYGLRSS